MVHLLLLWLVLFFRVDENAQEKNVIIASGIDRQPLVGVTIVAKGGSTTTISNSQGKFDPRVFNNTDSLQLTHVGYLSLSIAMLQLQDTILLFPANHTLENVMVRDWSAFEKKSAVGYFYASTNGRWGMIKGMRHASLINGDSTKEEWIRKVMIRFSSISSCDDRFHIRLLTFDKAARSPGQDLLSKPRQFTTAGAGKKVILDISDEHLIMPVYGVVAVIELIGRSADCPVSQHPRIACTIKKVKDHSWFGDINSAWYPDMSHPAEDKSMIPCIGLELAKRN
jgi:hypothetical protein